jgi:putative cardiolipin synthase
MSATPPLMMLRRLIGIALLALLLAGCAAPLPAVQRTPSHALTDTAGTTLARELAHLVDAHPGVSGLHVFTEPHDAFAARVLLADKAERTVDAQYFIWHDDAVGMLLWQALWNAAERGVRVRLLLDDATGSAALDPLLAALDAHPNIELRLYNPFVGRGSRAWGYVSDLGRLNQRMHNKSFTADNQATIVGGRNIADEYFGAAEGLGFADLDVIAIGPVVHEVSKEFDLYWNSASAFPAAPFVGAGGPAAEAALKARFATVQDDPRARQYLDAVRGAAFLQDLMARRLQIEWTTAQVLYDDPGKTLDGGADEKLLLMPVLIRRMGEPRRSLDIVSPYFVPGAVGTAGLTELARKGVRVRVLTNSLASSDERVVHAGYMKRRQDLLRAGVELYEMKPGAADGSLRVRGRIGPAKVAGLHAKSYAVDGERAFIGSFNLDQRSAHLNTEMGLVIDSPAFAEELAAVLDDALEYAYSVRLAPDGQNLQWLERRASGETVLYDVDPESTAWQRFQVSFLAGLPIDWLL